MSQSVFTGSCRSSSYAHLFVSTLVILLPQVRCLQYITNSSLPAANLTADCANALTVSISCDPFVAGFCLGVYCNPSELEAVCTVECDQALVTYEVEV